MERIPHIWCPGCGIGTTVNCFARALHESGLNLDKVAVVSGIGCTGRVAGYVKLDSFHTTHGRAIPFATGLKLANPESHGGGLLRRRRPRAIGGNHLIHAARRNIDIKVSASTTWIYAMTGGQTAPTTPGLRAHLDVALRTVRAVASTCRSWPSGRRVLRGPLDHLPRQAAHPLHDRGSQAKGFSSSRCFRRAPRSSSGATSWATGWTR
jgi:TPP-dependent indolepyruvate ferredoxin oxidoreductase alpha subunit